MVHATPRAEAAMLEAGSDRSTGRAREDYVKAIFALGEEGLARAADVARYLGVTPVAVSKARRVLEREGLLEPAADERHALELTERGCGLAVAMIRRHRLLETFLYRSLGIPLERIHAEAERIEHVFRDDLADRLERMLGNPRFDPHGHPIPPAGERPAAPPPRLTAFPSGTEVCVVSLDDREGDALKALAGAGVLPGVRARLEALDASGVRLKFKGRTVRLSRAHAALVRVRVV